MRIRCAGHVDVRAHDGDEAGVVPIRRFMHIGLLAPDFGAGGRQVAVPVIERHRHAAHQGQEARPCRVGYLRHGRDGREAVDAVGAIFFDRVNDRGGNHLQRLVPVDAAETALAARLLVTGALLGIVHDRFPGRNRVVDVPCGQPATGPATRRVRRDISPGWGCRDTTNTKSRAGSRAVHMAAGLLPARGNRWPAIPRSRCRP